jgi:hypothetical protein
MMAYDETKNLEVIGVTARASFELAKLFGFDVPDYGGDQMLALQGAIYDIFGKQIDEGTLNTKLAQRLSRRERLLLR